MNNLDPQYLAIATAIVGVISSIITQTAKRYIPDKWRSIFALGISVLVAVVSFLIVGLTAVIRGDSLNWNAATVTTAIFGVIGVAQAIYAAVYKLVANKTDIVDNKDSK